MKKERAIKRFTEHILGRTVEIHKSPYDMSFNFGMDVFGKRPALLIPKNLDCKFSKADKKFRKNFISRCSLARGFSNATISVLHECGHWETRSIMDFDAYMDMKRKVHNMEDYMNIPWEHLATDWAICWLASPKNRKVAKQFEREYFGYGKVKASIQY